MAQDPPHNTPDLNIDVRPENAKLLFPKRRWITASPEDDATAATRPRVRKLVLCFDGTGNQFSDKNSNLLRFYNCLCKKDMTQVTYYQPGFGTASSRIFKHKSIIWLSKKLDKAIAWNFERHVQDAYTFLMQNYRPGDKVSLFGFSRGAYTARVLCGFVQKVGLLLPNNHHGIPFAWEVFEHSDDKGGLERCANYKRNYSLSVNFDFIGLWDTVASLGIHGRELPFFKPDAGGIRIFRQALALDERRTAFKPNFKLTVDGPQSEPETHVHPLPGPNVERLLDRNVREVWFAGCHSDVGGGSEDNEKRNSLARIPLRWMIRECFRTDTGIIFDKDMLVDIGFGATPCYEDLNPTEWKGQRTKHKSASNDAATSFTGVKSFLSNVFRRQKPDPAVNVDTEPINEHMEERKDALSNTHDQLSRTKIWWLLEWYPKKYRVQDSSGGNCDDSKRDRNLGKGRKIYGDAWNTIKDHGEEGEVEWYIEVHESVRTRIKEYEGPKSKHYKPLAWFSVPGANGQNASVSEFRWEGEFEKMCASQAGQMICWVK